MTLPQNSAVIINIIVVVAILISLIVGYIKGFLWQIIRLIGIIAVIILAWILSPGLGKLIHVFPKRFSPFASTGLADLFYDKINSICWFVIILIVGFIILAILNPLIKVVTEIPVLKQVNNILGAVLSTLPTLVIILLVTYILNSAIFTNGKTIVDQSVLRYSSFITENAGSVLSKVFSENSAIQKMINDPKSLTKDDLKSITEWMKNHAITSEQIREFLSNYGIDVQSINDLLN